MAATSSQPEIVAVDADLRDRMQRAREAWRGARDRRDKDRRLISFANGDQISSTPPMPNEPLWHREIKPLFAPNILGQALAQLSYLYSEDPIRESPDADRWEEILWDFGPGLSAILADADPRIRLTGAALAYVLPAFGDMATRIDTLHGVADDATPIGVDVVVLDSSRYVAIPSPYDVRQVEAVAIHVATREIQRQREPNGPTWAQATEVVHYWDREWYATLHDWQIVSLHRHNYGRPPVALLKNTLSPLSLTGDPLGGADLLRNLRSLNALYEEYLHTSRLQRGQPVIIGEAKNLQLGPDCAVEESEPGDFSIVANQANLSGMRDAIQVALDSLAIAWGLPRRSMSLDDRSSPSPAQLVADRSELREDERIRSRLARTWERGIHAAASAVWGAWTGETLDPSVEVEYPPGMSPRTHAERLAEAEFLLSHGLASRWRVAQILNPSASDMELAQLLAEADEDLEERTRRMERIAGHAMENLQVEALATARAETSQGDREDE